MRKRMISVLPVLAACLLCGCQLLPHNARTGAKLRADEISVLGSVYSYDAKNIAGGTLSGGETHLLSAYRFFKAYFSETYPNDSFEFVSVSPRSPHSPTGSPHDTFYVRVNGGADIFAFRLLETDGAFEITGDTYGAAGANGA